MIHQEDFTHYNMFIVGLQTYLLSHQVAMKGDWSRDSRLGEELYIR